MIEEPIKLIPKAKKKGIWIPTSQWAKMWMDQTAEHTKKMMEYDFNAEIKHKNHYELTIHIEIQIIKQVYAMKILELPAPNRPELFPSKHLPC